jgi:hypothetical protein
MRSGQQGGNPPQTVLRLMVYEGRAFGWMNAPSQLAAAAERRTVEALVTVDQSSGAGP